MSLAAEDLDLLVFIRRFEEALLDLFAAGELSGTTHTCLGQEYIPVALAPLTRDDFVFSNHRGHGHYLAHTGDADGLLAELMGRDAGPCRGVGGSQHLFGERFLSTGVQGESLPVAVGVALHFKRSGQDRIVIAYVGDGTWGEGAVYEALNLAALWQVPLLVVVENNGIAQTTPTRLQLAGSVEARARAFGVGYERIRTMDVEQIRLLLAPCLARVRHEHSPLVAEFETVRLGPHSKGDDTRSGGELEALREQDWLRAYQRSEPERVAAADVRQRRRVAQLIESVRQQPLSGWEPSDVR
ncbi:MAG TPA: thiamine pyrophosphate-dependent dehydrogenase E1 component subunit alpha [Streptosporangiaceae bacterium]|nr:thiamine pyrophosphate-dependent dehydrogenase E1 component subunit alpha [Streptosporangiaceae bacterium]